MHYVMALKPTRWKRSENVILRHYLPAYITFFYVLHYAFHVSPFPALRTGRNCCQILLCDIFLTAYMDKYVDTFGVKCYSHSDFMRLCAVMSYILSTSGCWHTYNCLSSFAISPPSIVRLVTLILVSSAVLQGGIMYAAFLNHLSRSSSFFIFISSIPPPSS